MNYQSASAPVAGGEVQIMQVHLLQMKLIECMVTNEVEQYIVYIFITRRNIILLGTYLFIS